MIFTKIQNKFVFSILVSTLLIFLAVPARAEIKFTNNATSSIADVGGISDVDTSLTVETGDGAYFPALTSPSYFMATLVDSSGNREIVKVTARATDTFTIVRAQEGTTARAYAAGSIVSHRLTAGVLDEFAKSVVQNVEYLSNYDSLSAAITAIGATQTELVLDEDDTMAGNVTVPATLTLRPLAGSVITTDSNTLALNGPISGNPTFQWLSGVNVSYGGNAAFRASWIGSAVLAGAAIDGAGVPLIIDRDDTGSGNVDLSSYDILSIDVIGALAGGNRLILPGGHPYKLSWRSNLADTITDIAALSADLIYDEDIALSDDPTHPITTKVIIPKGITVTTTGYTLTFDGQIENYGTITGTGAVAFNGMSVNYGEITGAGTITITGGFECCQGGLSTDLTISGLKYAEPDYFTVNETPGTTEMGPAIDAALDAASEVCLKGEYLNTTTELTVDVGAQYFHGVNAIMDFESAGSQTLLTITNSQVADQDLRGSIAASNPIAGIVFKGPGKAVADVRFCTINDSVDTTIWGTTFENGGVLDFAEGIYFGDGTYMDGAQSFHMMGNGWCINIPSGVTNSGERHSFIDCTFANNDDVLIHANGNANTHFIDCSFDYCVETFGAISSGDVYLTNCHIEARTDVDNWWSVTGINASLTLQSCVVVVSLASADMTHSPFYVDAACLMGGVYINNTRISSGGTYTYPVLIAGTGPAQVGNILYFQGHIKPPIGDAVNVTSYGTFESADWANDFTLVGDVTPARNSSDQHTGTYSLLFTQVGAGTHPSASLFFLVDPGDLITGSVYFKCDMAGTNGTFQEIVDFVDQSGTSLASYTRIQETGDVAVWTYDLSSLAVRAPKGAYQCKVTFRMYGVTAGTATARIDDLIINKS